MGCMPLRKRATPEREILKAPHICKYLCRPMASFPHDSIKPFSEGDSKKAQIGHMFDSIAGRYDFMNRALSLGIDRIWRKKAIAVFKADGPKHLLDVATGTADMALQAARILKPEKIIGIDISENMLAIGRQKVAAYKSATQIELLQGDSETINFGNDTFDGAMVAFGVRNFENLEQGLVEIRRVLKPGARLVVLEFSKPKWRVAKAFYNLYMGRIAPQVAGWFRQNKKAYQYLNNSAKAFPDREHFVNILANTGYTDTSFKPLSLGICCIYTGRKPTFP
jgi:demethylmenaquinone methyltransferase/2-methoxy-6-polyprenyl-1,4-benzoquinol methylase